MSKDGLSKAAPWVAIALTAIAMILAAALWLPAMAHEEAQEQVQAQAKTQEQVDKSQDDKIKKGEDKTEALTAAVNKLAVEQGKTNTKLDAIIQRMDRRSNNGR